MIAGCSYFVIRSLMKVDPEHGMCFLGKQKLILLAGSIISALLYTFVTEGIGWLGIYIYFVIASLTDSMICKVYDILQYPAFLCGVFILIKSKPDLQVGIVLLIFFLLQYFVFMRFFGAADGMAFMVAALAEASLGYDITIYLFHMICAYLLLSVVQILKGNVGRNAKLKVPVPFLPCIMISFWGILLFGDQIHLYM